MTKITGGCSCGAVRYELSDEPILQLVCHCSDCQKASGSAFAEVLVVAADRLSMVSREPTFFSVKAESGRTMSRGFCATCGSPVMIRSPEKPAIAYLQAGSLDDPAIFRPAIEVYTCRAHPMIKPMDGVTRFERSPPPEMGQQAVAAHFAKRS